MLELEPCSLSAGGHLLQFKLERGVVLGIALEVAVASVVLIQKATHLRAEVLEVGFPLFGHSIELVAALIVLNNEIG